MIPNQNEKVQSVKLCPIASEPDYGHTVAALCEGSVVRLFNVHSGDIIAEHRQHEVGASSVWVRAEVEKKSLKIFL